MPAATHRRIASAATEIRLQRRSRTRGSEEDHHGSRPRRSDRRHPTGRGPASGGRRLRGVRHHRRSREGDDLSLAVLYRLERRGLLNCPVLGVSVDDWSVDQLCSITRANLLEGTGEDGRRRDASIGSAARLSYVQGDFADADTYQRVADAIGSAASPVFYLEIPPFLFATVIKGLCEVGIDQAKRHGSWSKSRSGMTSLPRTSSRPTSTSTSTSPSCTGSITTSARWASRSSCTCASRTRCSSLSGIGTLSTTCRSRWPRTLVSKTVATFTTRSARCATCSSITCCSCWRWRRWRRPAGADAGHPQRRQVRAVSLNG